MNPLTGRAQLSRKAWWTAADQAELDVLVDAFVGAVFDYRRCSVCAAGGPWCDAVRDCFHIVIDWRNTRARRSEAAWLGVLHDEAPA